MLLEKYRPSCFDDVVGNKDVVDAIKNSLNSGIGCRTLLITGPNGVGKTTLARIIGMHLGKANSEEELNANLNYYEIDCSISGSVEDIRSHVYNFNFKGLGSGHKVYVFDECSILSPIAQRVLLKSIENKNLYFNYFIFVTSAPDKLLPDLIDRLTERNLQHVKRTDILRNLERICRLEKLEVDKNILIDISTYCSKKIRKSLHLLEEYISLPDDSKALWLGKLKAKSTQQDDKTKDNQQVASAGSEIDGGNSKKTNEEQAEMNSETLHGNTCTNVDLVAIGKATAKAFESLHNKHVKLPQFLDVLQRAAITSTEILDAYYPEPRIFMAPFIKEGALVMIYAGPGVGKSWLSLSIALALTRDKGAAFEIGNYKVVEQCGVVIVDGELSGYEIQSRLSLLSESFGQENQDTPLRIISSLELADDTETLINLDDEKWRASIYWYMRENPQNKVLVLDNLSSLCGGDSENSRESITKLNRWLFSFRRIGVAVVIIHHSNKSGDYRGHSGKVDNLHTVINLKRYKNVDQICFKVDYNKGRSAIPGDAKNFIAEVTPHPDNPKWLTWNWYFESNEKLDISKDDEIIAYLLANKVTQHEVAKHFGVSQSKVSKCRRMAIEQGYLTKKGEIMEAGRQFLENHVPETTDDQKFNLAA